MTRACRLLLVIPTEYVRRVLTLENENDTWGGKAIVPPLVSKETPKKWVSLLIHRPPPESGGVVPNPSSLFFKVNASGKTPSEVI